MTVCVGICSDEGAVLAADSQITRGNISKRYGPKICFIGNRRFSVGLAGAGYKDLMDLGFEEIRRATAGTIKPNAVRKKIERELALLAGLYPEEIQEQEWLCAIACPPDRVKLLSFRKYLPAPTGTVAIIGCGNSSLSDHLASWITERPEFNSEALRWAIFLITRAKEFVPGCGGPINALVFTADGRVVEKRPEETAQIEEELTALHGEFSGLFRTIAIGKPQQPEADLQIKAFGGRVKGTIFKNTP